MSLLVTAAVAVTWLATAALMFGLGAALLRSLTPAEQTWRTVIPAIYSGMALLFAGLILWHFFRPVDELALLVFVVAGGVAIFRQRAWVTALWRAPMSKLHALPILAFCIWSANHALRGGGWDDYVYEFQAIRWFHDYAIVPGLANVHGRFGFNNAHHLYAAMFSVGPWEGAVNVLVNGLFINLLFALAWTGCADLLKGKLSERAVFAAVFIAPCVARHLPGAELSQPMISTLKADVASGALLAGAACLWVELSDRTTSEIRRTVLAIAVALCLATAFAIRVSSGPFVAIMLAAVFTWMAARSRARVWLPVGAIVAVLVAGMMIRGIVLSGYPLYPSTAMAADVDWRVPAAQADIERTLITTHAQWRSVYATAPPPGSWLLDWGRATLVTNRSGITLPAALVLGLAPLLVFKRRRDIPEVAWFGWLTLGTATAAALGVWFLYAPSGRFAWAYCWIAAAAVGARIVSRVPRNAIAVWPPVGLGVASALAVKNLRFPRSEAIGFGWGIVLAAAWCAGLIVSLKGNGRRVGMVMLALGLFPVVDRVATDIFYRRLPQLARTFWVNSPRIPKRAGGLEVRARETRSGLTVYEAQYSRYDYPLPTTPHFNRYLELRTPPDFAGGFRNVSPGPYPRFGYRPNIGTSDPDE